MQKRPKYPYSYSPIDLAEDFPFMVSEVYEQKDRTITHLHFHNFPELGICLEGSGVFVVESKILPFRKGDLVYIGRNERHLARSVHGTVSRWHWIYFDPEKILYPAFMNSKLADLSHFKGPSFSNLIPGTEYSELCTITEKMLETQREKGCFFREKITALLLLFSAEMKTAFPEQESITGKDAADIDPEPDIMQRLHKALELIASGHRSQVKMSALASSCGLSPTHFRRLFRKAFGKSPHEYLNQMRISMAMAELARSKKPVSEIALSCGFETISSFNRQFKTQTGKSPRLWRGQTQNQ